MKLFLNGWEIKNYIPKNDALKFHGLQLQKFPQKLDRKIMSYSQIYIGHELKFGLEKKSYNWHFMFIADFKEDLM